MAETVNAPFDAQSTLARAMAYALDRDALREAGWAKSEIDRAMEASSTPSRPALQAVKTLWPFLAVAPAPAHQPDPQGAGEAVAWACKTCNSPRAVDPCWKCGTALTKPADGWEWPGLPDIDRIRELAREVGYAVGVHGTMERDLDLIAAPWVAEAVGPLELAQNIAAGLGGRVINAETQDKPCGRWSCNIHTPDWTKLIDLSVMTPAAPPPPPPADTAMREALEPFAAIARDYLTGGLKADLESRAPDLIRKMDARHFYAALAALNPSPAATNTVAPDDAEGRADGDPDARAIAAGALRRFNAFVDRKAMMDKLGHPLTEGEWPHLVEATRDALAAIAGDADDGVTCGICHVAFVADDLCLTDVDLGTVHARCCGPERESYVNLTTLEPLAEGQPIPAGWRWGDVIQNREGAAHD